MEELRALVLERVGDDGVIDHPLGGCGGAEEGGGSVEVEVGGRMKGVGGVETGVEGRGEGEGEEGGNDGGDEQTQCQESEGEEDGTEKVVGEEPPAFVAAHNSDLMEETQVKEKDVDGEEAAAADDAAPAHATTTNDDNDVISPPPPPSPSPPSPSPPPPQVTIVPWRYMMRTAPRVHPAIQAQRIAELRAWLVADDALGVDNLHEFDYGFPFYAQHQHDRTTPQKPSDEAAMQDSDSSGDDKSAMPRRSMGDDFVLHRFLRARQFDVANARTMYLDMMAWRADNDVDGICDGIGESKDMNGPPGDGRVFSDDEQTRWNEVYRQGYHGVDKGGRPIYIERIGGISHARIVGVTTPERLYKKTIRSYEYLWRSLIPHCSKMRNATLRLQREEETRRKKSTTENETDKCTSKNDDGEDQTGGTENDPGDDGNGNVIIDQMTSIMDIEGIRLIDFDSKLRKLMKTFFKMASSSYPESLFKV